MTTVAEEFAARDAPTEALASDAEGVARACHDMARRFHAGGQLLVFGIGECATDAQHVAVEFVHPVIVGKRALPALALTNDVATVTALAASAGLGEVFAHQVRQVARPVDIALGISSIVDDEAVHRGLETARELGLLTVAVTGSGASVDADHVFVVASDDALVVKEVEVTIYHLLWELAHVFFEQPGVLAP